MPRSSTPLPCPDDLVRLAMQCNWKVRKLSVRLGLSSRQLERRFQTVHSMPPHRWMDRKRFDLATKFIVRMDQAKSVAFDLGFANPSQFSNWFKQHASITATEFAKGRQ